MKKQIKQAVEAICAARRIVLTCHINPDGDTLGCVLALAHALRALDKEVTVLAADGVPDIYCWMPGVEWVETGTERRDFDLAIVCDAGALDRVGRSVMPVVESAPCLIDIDHHVADGVFGDVQVVDATAAATAELVWQVIRALSLATGKELATREVAECLMTGIVTDTGSFRFLNVTPRTFLLAARLQRLGALPAPIAENVFENRSFASLKLLGRALDSLQTTPDGRIAWAHVTAQDYEELGATDAETEGIVNHVRSVRNAQVGILFREVPGHKVRISIRARDGADVNKVARVFGGGGHKLAAGCSLDPPLAEAERLVVAETERQLGKP
ncbi:MAG TPA: bifunctional oligoribonuclease/PAP phosphatase NrnA [Chthonomonadaceae bacterium]|nr:bifunctional oligoribonuclease/PAP phosphatase NrnA [Chthonomonadaceae bacterium]